MPIMRETWKLPLITGVSAGALYFLTMQTAYFDDGIRFDWHIRHGPMVYIHLAYLPLVAAFRAAVSWLVPIEPELAMKLVSALAGAVGVALTCRITALATGSQTLALAVVILLAGSVGYWFHSTATELHTVHTAFSCVLLLGLVRALRSPDAAPRELCAVLALGALVTPGSHASGIASGLPVLVVIWYVRKARVPYLLALGTGYGVFLAIYLALYSNFSGYSAAQTQKLGILLGQPGLLPEKLQAVAGELLLFAVPASTLVPAGLLLLRHRDRRLANLLLAWPILAIPVGDRAWGSNFVTTFPVQAMLAVIALRHLLTSRLQATVVVVLCMLPTAVMTTRNGYDGLELIGLLTWLGCAAILFALASSRNSVGSASGAGRWPLLLPVLALCCNAVLLVPILRLDPIRDRIRAVARVASDNDMVICLASNANHHLLWTQFLPNATGDRGRFINPYVIDTLPDDRVAAELAGYRERVFAALDSDRPVWLVRLWPGSPENHMSRIKTEALQGFLGEVLSRCKFTQNAAASGLSRGQAK